MQPFTPPDAEEWIERLRLSVSLTDIHGFREAITPPIIVLGRRQTPRAQRWLTFHAIGHVELHRGNQLAMLRGGRTQDVQRQERQAECWAARTLVPATVLDAAMRDGLDVDELCDLFDVPASRLDYAIKMHGARVREEHSVDGVERTIVPSAADLEAYLRDKDAIDREARLSGWKPGQSRGGVHGW